MACKGICHTHAVKKRPSKDGGPYESGQKRCSFCEIYIMCVGAHCPCCGCALRSNPRNAKSRKKLRAKILVSQQLFQ